MKTRSKGRLYRSRRGTVLGVCKGLADYWEIPVFWIRLTMVLLSLSGFFMMTFTCYIILAILMKPEPLIPLSSLDEDEFYNSYASNRSVAVARLRDMMKEINDRVTRIESRVTSKEFDWERRFNKETR